MLTLIVLMIGAGLMGATVNVAMSIQSTAEPATEHTDPWERWRWNAIAGVGAALLVPLFLKTVSSGLLTEVLASDAKGESLVVFGGFCLLASISSKKFIESLSEKLLRETREEVARTRNKLEGVVKETQEVSQQAEHAARVATAAAETVAPGRTVNAPVHADADSLKGAGDALGDPWKGTFGGLSEANNRKLDATLSPIDGDSQLMAVHLRVTSTNHANPLTGTVQFYLHPTFPQHVRTIAVKDGHADLNVISYGAFTAGAETDDGQVKLELDLSTLPNATDPWRSR
ncbi:MAG: hypothetical protein JSR62_11010 [Nitrospira sp.]|nr:hypothetical protein [Nitrospira sp.]